MRKVLYVTGTRADYGLMRRCLQELQAHPDIELQLCVTGSHLDPKSGHTVTEIQNDGFSMVATCAIGGHQATGKEMGRAFGAFASAVSDVYAEQRPDVVLLLGDRYEMLAAASTAVMQNIPVAHIHGGERSGTVDELFRHAISKLSHVHFASTENAAQRLIKMGERSDSVFVVGAPGLDGLSQGVDLSREDTAALVGIDATLPFALVVYHPVVQEQTQLTSQVTAVMEAVASRFTQAVILSANSDPGGLEINAFLDAQATPGFVRITHVERDRYLALLYHAACMLGNSSSGIIEAATFGTPVVNIGSRQNLRESGENVVHVDPDPVEITRAVDELGLPRRFDGTNIYGDGQAGKRILEHLLTVDLSANILAKSNVY